MNHFDVLPLVIICCILSKYSESLLMSGSLVKYEKLTWCFEIEVLFDWLLFDWTVDNVLIMYTFWRNEVCSCTFTFEHKFWFQFNFWVTTKLCDASNLFSLKHVVCFYKDFFCFKESVFWLGLSLRCKGIWSPLITGGSTAYLPIQYFLIVQMFIK